MTQNSQFDVVISGGGLSGLLTAVGLLNETPELSIAIIEPYDKSNTTAVANFDDRCLALSYGSLQLLNHWQIWQHLKPSAWPIKTIVTSDRGHFGKTIMRAQEYNLNAMGYVAAMRNIGQAFEHTLSLFDDHNLTWFRPDNIKDLTQYKEHVELHLESGVEISTKLLVVAEGGQSNTREKLNINTSTEPYSQSAIIANIEVAEQNSIDKLLLEEGQQSISNNTAFERFTTSGPIAFLPIGQGQYSVVWSVKPEDVDSILELDEYAFCQRLQQAFGFAAGCIIKTSKPTAYPLGLTVAESLISSRIALVGNSAHTIHPIAGQGFNLGLRDIAVLIQQIKSAVQVGADIGAYSLLNDYQTSRSSDIKRITGFTDMLVRMFGLEGRLAAFARTSGLMTLQKFDCLQKWLALHFMSSKQYAHSVKEER